MLKRWFKQQDKKEYALTSPGYPVPANPHRNLSTLGSVTFTLHPAEGGTVMETVEYDVCSDMRSNRLYVITDEKNLGEEISQILTAEALRRNH